MFFIDTATVPAPVAGAAAAGVLVAGALAAGVLAEVLFELELLLLPQPAASAPPSARQAATERRRFIGLRDLLVRIR
jgi:hypothetical protein